MMSHMLDCQLYGLNAGGHHLTNVLLHTASAILLFLVLRRMTGFLWRSAFVAAVFAIHPLRVESVAWVAERKDVLSGLFFMLTLWAYMRYAQASDRWQVTRVGNQQFPAISPRLPPVTFLRFGAVIFCVGSDVQADAGDAAVCAAAAGLLAAGTRFAAGANGSPVMRNSFNSIPAACCIEKIPLLGTHRRILRGNDFCPEGAI